MQLILRPNKSLLTEVLRQRALDIIGKIEPLVIGSVDNYITTLETEIGTIAGNTHVAINGVEWSPLSLPYGENKAFWYKTSSVEHSLAIGYKVSNNGLGVIAGIAPDSPGYQKALWNEFGFYPHDSDRLIRRPLFIPLAELHVRELNKAIHNNFSRLKVNISLKV